MSDLTQRRTIPFVDLGLVVLLVVGAGFAWHSGQKRWQAESELARLRTLIGEIDVVDPGKVHIQALNTGEPLHYAWRIYLPAGFNSKIASYFTLAGGNSWSSSSSTKPEHFLARVRFRRTESGEWEVYKKFHQGSSRSSLGNRALSDLFDKHGAQLVVEQAGVGEVLVFAPHETRDLLRILLPPSVQDEYRQWYQGQASEKFPEIMSVSIGDKEATP